MKLKSTCFWGLAVLLTGLAGCVAFGKLFAEKPPPGPPAIKPPVELVDGSKPGAAQAEVPPVALGAISNRYPFPGTTPVGAWCRMRVSAPGTDPVEEEWAVIGQHGNALWVEHASYPSSRTERQVTLRLVDPAGTVLRGVRGRAGGPPLGTLEPRPDEPALPGPHETLLEGAPSGQEEQVTVPAGTFRCTVVALGDEGKAWVDRGVPFHGLVRLVLGSDPSDQLEYTLVAHGTDRREGLLSGGVPRPLEPNGR